MTIRRATPTLRTCMLVAPLALLAACDTGPAGLGSDPVRLPAFACGERTTPIHAIQGTGASSPFAGVVVDTEGVVTANWQRGLGGFFIQSVPGEADADEASSEGLFVRSAEPRRDIKVGLRVRLRATVLEQAAEGAPAGLTSLEVPSELALCGAAPLPDPWVVAAVPPDWERFEGMRIAVPGPVTLTSHFELLRFGRAGVSLTGRLFQPTERFAPGPEARALAESNERASLLIDDNRESEFPDKVWWMQRSIQPSRPWRTGTELKDLVGVLDERDGRHRLQLQDEPGAVYQAPRPDAPPAVGGSHSVAAFNLLNWFNGDGRGGGFPTARGAADPRQADRQRDKLVAAIARMQPDIVALMELENDGHGEDSAIAQLVAALNRAVQPGDYRLVDPGIERLGGDEIKVGLVYRAGRVREAGKAAFIEGGAFAGFNRVPLAQAFEPVDGGARVVVVANHWKSKGGCPDAEPSDRDRGDGQGCYNARRVDAARALADWLATDPTGAGSTAALVVGDLNAYGQEDPVRLLRQRGYVDTLAQFAGDAVYSFVYDGFSGQLDHALASAALAPRVTGAAEWHINADELTAFDFRREDRGMRRRGLYAADPFRSSDHDPLVVGLELVGAGGGAAQ
jgi:predicted extracellular nuclease